MANLGVIKDLCKQNELSVRKLAEKIEVKPTTLQSAIDKNSTSIELLEKVANYFRVPISVFFDQNSKLGFIENIEGYNLPYVLDNLKSYLDGISLLKRIIGTFASNLAYLIECFYTGQLYVREGKHYEQNFFDKLLDRKGKLIDGGQIKATRSDFIEFWLNDPWDSSDGVWREFYDTKILLEYHWKFTRENFLTFQKIGVINSKECILLILWTDANYNEEKFLDSYELYKKNEELKKLLKDIPPVE